MAGLNNENINSTIADKEKPPVIYPCGLGLYL